MDRRSLRTDDSPAAHESGLARRKLLALAAGTAAAGTAGCVRRVRSLISRDNGAQVSLTIKTTPADADPWAIRIARYLQGQLAAAGIKSSITPLSREALYRDVLLDQKFDLYVAVCPGRTDPDFLRSLCHSRFSAEPGWQNPFGYANLDLDELLERQRGQAGTRRRSTLSEIQKSIARTQPFSVVAFPDAVRATRSDEFVGWNTGTLHTALGYLTIDPAQAAEETTLRMTITDARPTKNHNPLAVEFRTHDQIADLLYDPLGRWVDGDVVPWLAAEWNWSKPPTSPGPTATVTLRDDLTWHDGTPITASDVAFTYEFLADTSLGNMESPVPAPRFRGRGSLVDTVEVEDEHTARVSFVNASQEVARRAFTVPLLPKHVWAEKSATATVAGFDTGGSVTEALVWGNPQPVGSGPLRFAGASAQESITLERNDEHFLVDAGTSLPQTLERYRGGFSPDRLRFVVVPSGGAAVELVRNGDSHATASPVTPADVPRIGRSEQMDLHVSQPPAFYHVGYNIRRGPLSSPRFRRGIARLLDKQFIVEDVFDGYAQPAASPLARHEALAPSLAWTGNDPVLPFPGRNGKLNVEQARQPFKRAGYRYSEDGKLLSP